MTILSEIWMLAVALAKFGVVIAVGGVFTYAVGATIGSLAAVACVICWVALSRAASKGPGLRLLR